MSAPYHSQSNGKAEAAVKIVKRLLKRSPDPYRAILEWRNTPTVELGTSPCQRLLGRRTRGVVPVPASKLMPSSPVEMWEKKAERQRKIQEYKTRSGRNLPPLQVGEPVLVQDVKARKTQWERGYCRDKLSSRSYVVEVEGQLLHRNRQFLKPSKNLPMETTEQAESPEPEAESSGPPLRTSELLSEKEGSPNVVRGSPALRSSQAATQVQRPEVIQRPNVGTDSETTRSSETTTNIDQTGEIPLPLPHQNSGGKQPQKLPEVPVTTRSGRQFQKPMRFQDYVKL